MASGPSEKTLFEYRARQREEEQMPLAARMRPTNLEQFTGQEHLLGFGRVLEKAIRTDRVPSSVLWGPPGVGKTTLAFLVAKMTNAHFSPISAVTSGVADLRRIVVDAKERWVTHGQRTILFVDEVHRFNKAQQDVILPHVEAGTVTFIGATTENPSFEVIAPLLSRCRVFTMKPLTNEEIAGVVHRALADTDRGIGSLQLVLTDDAMEVLLHVSSGDARAALNAIELAANLTTADGNGKRIVDRENLESMLQQRVPRYDKKGESHYDTISAYIKSVRSSDPDAAIYWLARMIDAGEDPRFIVRRMVILAAEDVGLADPQALMIAIAAQQAIHFIGLPEGAIPLAEATIYLATAPKSNTAYIALNQAMREIQTGPLYPVPLNLRNAVTDLMTRQGYGKGYRYAHDYPEHFSGQQNLPMEMGTRQFYRPSDQGYEIEISKRIKRWKEINEQPLPN